MEQFIQLTKVDQKLHQVWGRATTERLDGVGEVMHYGKSKPNFLKWSDDFFKASGQKSRGNLRSMHQPIASGRIIQMDLRDDSKEIYIGAEVVDAEEWKKVEKGVYTGFSIGGKYGETWTENGTHYYEAIPTEISLVDKPCNQDARFEFVRADGASELHKFEQIDQEIPMEKVFPPKKEEAPAAPPADGAKAEAPAQAEKPAVEEAKQPAANQEATPGAANPADPQEHSAVWAIIEAALKAGTMAEEVAAKLKQTIQADEAEEAKQVVSEEQGEGSVPQGGQMSSGLPAQADAKIMRSQMLSLLEELGLVERTEGGAMKVEPTGLLRKGDLDADLSRSTDTLTKRIDDGHKALAGDFARLAVEVEALEKRMSSIAGLGPVIREIGTQSQGAMQAMQKAEQLRAVIGSTSDPIERERMQLEITRLEIAGTYK